MSQYPATSYSLRQYLDEQPASQDWNLGYGLSQSTQFTASQYSIAPAEPTYAMPSTPVLPAPQPQFSITKVWCEENQEWFWPYEHEVLCSCKPPRQRLCLSQRCHEQRAHLPKCQLQHLRIPQANPWVLFKNKK